MVIILVTSMELCCSLCDSIHNMSHESMAEGFNCEVIIQPLSTWRCCFGHVIIVQHFQRFSKIVKIAASFAISVQTVVG